MPLLYATGKRGFIHMKKFTRIAAAAVAASMMAMTAFTCLAATTRIGPGYTQDDTNDLSDDGTWTSQPPLFTGTVSSVEDNMIVLLRDIEGGTDIVNIKITEYTRMADGADGTPLALTDISAGSAVNIYVGETMTLSLPPTTDGVMVIVGAPADSPVPVYTRIESAENVEGSYLLKTSDGNQYVVNSKETEISPYRTKNIVKAEDLRAGMEVLLWPASDGSQGVSRVMVFGDGGQQEAVDESNWTWTGEVWTYSINGVMQTGWVFDKGKWYYLDPATGAMLKSCFISANGNTYYLTDDGSMLTEPRTFTPDASGALH